VSTSGTAYTGRANGIFSTNDQAKLKQAGAWPTAIAAPSAPTAASATAGNLQATVAFTTPSSLNGETITSYTVTSSPGGVTATGASSPITVSGLTDGTSYTFTVVANTASGASLSSSSSSSITIVAITYSDEMFSTYLITTNGSNQTINNGIDLAGKGGMVWFKSRGYGNHHLYSTNSGNKQLRSDTMNAYIVPSTTNKDLVSYNNDGFTIGNGEYSGFSTTGENYVSWTFRKAPKFFDVVTYTGTGSARTIAHSLGTRPGMIIIKQTDASSNWYTWHRGAAGYFGNTFGYLNTTGTFVDQGPSAFGGPVDAGITDTVFSVDTQPTTTNIIGATYVAYLFAHDTSAGGMIQCGSVTSTAGGTISAVNLGWEPQFILIKNITSAWDWEIHDVMRGWSIATNANAIANAIKPNLTSSEGAGNTAFTMTPTGFYSNANFGVSQTFIYMAIRSPNKPPTSGTQVYNAITRTGTQAVASISGVGFAPDFMLTATRSGISYYPAFHDKLRGARAEIWPPVTTPEQQLVDSVTEFNNDGVKLGADANGSFGGSTNSADPKINYFFKRAPGFFEMVCYTGTDSNQAVAHNLGVIPELIFAKRRNGSGDWCGVRRNGGSIAFGMSISSSSALQYGASFPFAPSDISLTATSMNPQFFENSAGSTRANASGGTYVAYLFATLAGISKVGTYTGNGSSQTINCGFAAGARFILIKRTDATGDWYVWDTTRGIVGANDPHLVLNTVTSEVTTDDSIDPDNSGFIVNQVAATNINVSSATYIFLAIA
jgi:hypothetical protein